MYNELTSYLIEFSICLAAFTVLFFVLFRSDKNFEFNRYYLLLIPLFSLMIPNLYYSIALENMADYSAVFYSPSTIGDNTSQTVSALDATSSALNWKYLIAILYFAGLLLSLLRLSIALFKFHSFKRDHTAMNSDGINVISVEGLSSPFSMFKTIVLPEQHPNLKFIEHHERSHCKRNHSWDIIYYEILSAIFWFHPLIYILKTLIKEQHEYSADSDAIRECQSKFLYASVLVNQSTDITNELIPFANHFYSSQIKNRLKMIAKQKNLKITALKISTLVPVLVMLIITFSVHFESIAQDTKEYDENKIYTWVWDDTSEERELRIKEVIEDKAKFGISVTRDDIIFLPIDEWSKLANEKKPYIYPLGNTKIKEPLLIYGSETHAMGFASPTDYPIELISNTLTYTRVVDEKTRKMETISVKMLEGKFPSDIDFSDPRIVSAKISDIKVKQVGKPFDLTHFNNNELMEWINQN